MYNIPPMYCTIYPQCSVHLACTQVAYLIYFEFFFCVSVYGIKAKLINNYHYKTRFCKPESRFKNGDHLKLRILSL